MGLGPSMEASVPKSFFTIGRNINQIAKNQSAEKMSAANIT